MEYALLKNIFTFAKSFYFFIGNLFVKREYNIVFYYPAHFNRGANGENEFLEPLYRVCEKAKIDFVIFEEPDFQKQCKRSKKAVPFDFPFIVILFLRKIISIEKFESFQKRDWHIAKLLKPFLFKRFTFKNYIVLSNSMLAFFRGLEKNANLYDYQHGVIYNGHIGYFTKSSNVPPHIKENDVNLLLYGKGFQNVLIKNSVDNYYKSHTYPFGIDRPLKEWSLPKERKKILFSLQFTGQGDWPDKQKGWFLSIKKFLEQNCDFFKKNRLVILMKHHPRYDVSLPINVQSLQNYSFVRFCNDDLMEIMERSFLHITFFSSTIFEASSVGVPTILWNNEYSSADVYTKDFEYPLGITDTKDITKKIEQYLQNEDLYIEDSKSVYSWYKNTFSPLDEKLFIELFTKDKSS